MLTRRACLEGGALSAAALAAGGCAGRIGDWLQPSLPDGWGTSEADAAVLRTLNRAAFGPRPGDLDRVHAIGLDAHLEEQLHPERLEESRAVTGRLWALDTLQVDTDFRFDFPKEQVQAELQQASVLRAVYSRRQLQEVMTQFWSDHFNVSQLKGDAAFMKTAEDEAVIRHHALGRFRDLLRASARSPAMLYYLDNARNTRDADNENYARELMELHTLGVDGGYTQRDVQEVARCFTGWSIHDAGTWWNGSFVFRPESHDDGARRVLGHRLTAGLGQKHGEQVLEILAGHPATARFIARKLCQRFIADDWRQAGGLVERLARTFRRTGGDIRQVMSVLLRSEEFQRGGGRKLKRPFDFAVSALRALDAVTDGQGVLLHLRRMGQAPFQWAMPNGYPDRAGAWLSSLLARWNFAVALCSGGIEGTRVDLDGLLRSSGAKTLAEQSHALQRAVLGRVLPVERTTGWNTRLRDGRPPSWEQAAALLLASPWFQWR
jgi:hypothetical protein